MENYYDYQTGVWVTSGSRYEEIASQPRFRPLEEGVLTPAESWERMLELLAAVPEDLVGYVGGGPLEGFLHAHAAEFIERIEAEARENPRFRQAVLEVDLARGALAPDVEARLLAAFGPRFTLLSPDDDPCWSSESHDE